VDGEVSEFFRSASSRASGTLGDEDQLPSFQGVLTTVDFDDSRAGYTHEDDIHLVVCVIPDAPANAEAHEVDV
jgi:hypothetical protein